MVRPLKGRTRRRGADGRWNSIPTEIMKISQFFFVRLSPRAPEKCFEWMLLKDMKRNENCLRCALAFSLYFFHIFKYQKVNFGGELFSFGACNPLLRILCYFQARENENVNRRIKKKKKKKKRVKKNIMQSEN